MLTDIEQAQELLRRCYLLINRMPEQQVPWLDNEINDLEITLYRYLK